MTISAVPFALQNVPINADIVRQAIASLIPNGGGLVELGDLAVTQLGTPAMGVSVGVGRAWIDGTNLAHLATKGYGKQGMYYILNDAAYTVTISTSDATNPRIDVIYAAVPDTAYSGASNTPVIAVATGTPTAGAAYPANAPSLPNNALALAWVYVGANVTTITTSNLTNLANSFNYRNAEFNSASVSQTSGNGTVLGALSSDTAHTFNNTFCHASANGIVTFDEYGTYIVSCIYSPGATYANSHNWAVHSSYGTVLSVKGNAYGNTSTSVSIQLVCNPGDTIQFGWTGDVTTNVTGHIRVTKIRG